MSKKWAKKQPKAKKSMGGLKNDQKNGADYKKGTFWMDFIETFMYTSNDSRWGPTAENGLTEGVVSPTTLRPETLWLISTRAPKKWPKNSQKMTKKWSKNDQKMSKKTTKS